MAKCDKQSRKFKNYRRDYCHPKGLSKKSKCPKESDSTTDEQINDLRVSDVDTKDIRRH